MGFAESDFLFQLSNFTMSRRCVEYFSPDNKQAGYCRHSQYFEQT